MSRTYEGNMGVRQRGAGVGARRGGEEGGQSGKGKRVCGGEVGGTMELVPKEAQQCLALLHVY